MRAHVDRENISRPCMTTLSREVNITLCVTWMTLLCCWMCSCASCLCRSCSALWQLTCAECSDYSRHVWCVCVQTARDTSSSSSHTKSGSVTGRSLPPNDSNNALNADKPPPSAKEKKGVFFVFLLITGTNLRICLDCTVLSLTFACPVGVPFQTK